MKIEKNVGLPQSAFFPTAAKVTVAGYSVEVTAYEKIPKPPPIKVLSAEKYVVTAGPECGEVKDFKRGATKADNFQSVSRTLAKIREIINTNVTIPQNCRWITLTYAENMTDAKRLYEDFKNFWKRFLYWNKAQGLEKPEYISVVEPQGRGAWHVHAFFIWPHAAPHIDNNAVLEKLWPFGFTKCKAVTAVDNPGAYFSAYLGDMELSELESLSDAERIAALNDGCDLLEKEAADESGKKVKKRIVKGARLALYPPGMNLYRTSRGIKRPRVMKMSYEDAQKKVSSAKLTFSQSYRIIDDSGKTTNTINRSYYNLYRGKCQE